MKYCIVSYADTKVRFPRWQTRPRSKDLRQVSKGLVGHLTYQDQTYQIFKINNRTYQRPVRIKWYQDVFPFIRIQESQFWCRLYAWSVSTWLLFPCTFGIQLLLHMPGGNKKTIWTWNCNRESADIAIDNTLTPARKTDIVVHSCKIWIISAYSRHKKPLSRKKIHSTWDWLKCVC